MGKYRQDINDLQESCFLRALPRRIFSALQLVCIMYAGFERIERERRRNCEEGRGLKIDACGADH